MPSTVRRSQLPKVSSLVRSGGSVMALLYQHRHFAQDFNIHSSYAPTLRMVRSKREEVAVAVETK